MYQRVISSLWELKFIYFFLPFRHNLQSDLILNTILNLILLNSNLRVYQSSNFCPKQSSPSANTFHIETHTETVFLKRYFYYLLYNRDICPSPRQFDIIWQNGIILAKNLHLLDHRLKLLSEVLLKQLLELLAVYIETQVFILI